MTEPINREHDPRWKVLGEYVREIADRMGLSRWYFDISHDLPDDKLPVSAGFCPCVQVERSLHSLHASLYFGDGFFEETLERQRHYIVHELVHVIYTPVYGALDTLSKEDCISNGLWNHWYQHFYRADELAVDLFAGLLAPSMPLIEWGENVGSK